MKKPTKHIEFTPRESRLLQQALGLAINDRENTIAGPNRDEWTGDLQDIEDMKALKARIRKAPAGVIAKVRLMLDEVSRKVRPGKYAQEAVARPATALEISEWAVRHGIEQYPLGTLRAAFEDARTLELL